MSVPDRSDLIRQAMLAPSVHNVQPARWRLDGADRLLLLEDVRCRLTVGDPRGNDAGISLGAAAEGLRLAAGLAGLFVEALEEPLPAVSGTLVPVAGYRLVPGDGAVDPLAGLVDARRSWRGAFAAVNEGDRMAAAGLVANDSAVVNDAGLLTELADLSDRASLGFMRDGAFRRELVSWMRLSRGHPRWGVDGLNAEAMAMGRIDALGAGMVLGAAFGPLDALRLVAPLLAEGGKVTGAAGLVVFHRPADEIPFVSGAAFYRLWLRIEQAGFGAAVHAALADDPVAAARVAELAGVPAGHRVVSTLRIGRRLAGTTVPRARRALKEVRV